MKKLYFFLFLSTLTFNSFAKKLDLSPVYVSLKNGDYEEVILKLDQIKNRDKSFLSTKSYLKGLSYARLQDFDKAKEFYIQAIKLKNRTADLYYELGQALYALNELEQARKSFALSERKGFNKYQSNYYIGHISQLLDENKKAKNYFSKILKDTTAPIDFKQIARFQLSESLLELARNSGTTKKYVKKYILPQMRKALAMKKEGATARDIKKRIKEIEKEFGLDPNLLVSGRRIPKKRWSASFKQKVEYDSNFTLTDDLPTSSSTKKDTFIFNTNFDVDRTFIHKRKYIFKPSLELDYVIHSDRENATVFSSDGYTISPAIEIQKEHKAFNSPASMIFKLEHDYAAKDKNGIKEKQFNNRTTTVTFGEKFKYFKKGNSTFKFKFKKFRSYQESLDNDVTTFSFDQLVFHKKKLFILLLQNDTTNFFNNITNNTNSLLFRLDYLYPNFLPKTTFNAAISNSFLTYEDENQKETRGTETNTTLSLKLTKYVRKNLEVNASYSYTKNRSDTESSNYTKHSTYFELGLNY